MAGGGTLAWSWDWLERWRGTLFVLGGLSGLVSAAVFGLDLLASDAWWRVWALAQTLEYLLPFVGLLGVYPALRGRTPTLACLGLGVAAIAITALVTNRVLLSVMGHDRPFGIVLVMVAAMIGGFLIFGLATWRTDVPSGRIGLSMLGVAGLTVVFFGVFVAPVHRAWPTAANVANAVTMLAIGTMLRAGSTVERPESGPVD